ncbi:uncharacterized protein Z519_01441 [Cladophialophora bantiana CBS 173.52]|uniref:Uncharacterized protein n=1 Tax=Cladophialophora bantiana (strain ATCC 10958 / CBS 173.52 / CDC B-1940 / NIH 8579) TaxID=1442370 RepID=A0A0D2GHK5_CLAB1|nr:uncharacterized protein Z519_01441 [Cladophialophora bantiana CBS 173.52]KIW97857.1 hypothetical protein Z519_01441 [Cladophialophora bantiana CBS 173.52]
MHYGIPLGVPPWGEQESLVWFTLVLEPRVTGSESRWGPVEFDFSTPEPVLRLADPNSPTEEPQHALPSWSWYSLTEPKFYAIDSAEKIKKQMISLLDEEGVRNVNHVTQGSRERFPDAGFLSDPLAMNEDITRTSPEDSTDVVQQVLADSAYCDMVKTHQRTLSSGVLLLVSNMVRVQLDEDFANWSLNILGNPLERLGIGSIPRSVWDKLDVDVKGLLSHVASSPRIYQLGLGLQVLSTILRNILLSSYATSRSAVFTGKTSTLPAGEYLQFRV